MAKRRRRRRLKKGPKIILLLIIIFIFGGIYLYTHSSKYLFLKGLDKSYNQIMDVTDTFITNYMAYSNDDYYSKINSSIKVNTSEIDTNINFAGDVYFNDLSNYFNLNIDTNGLEYQLEMLSKDNKLHFKIDDSKYYYNEFSNIDLSNENYFNLLELFVNNLKDNVKSANFEKENSTVIINSKNYNTKKITLQIDNELYSKIIKSFYSDIKDNNDRLDGLLSLTDFSTRKELIEYLTSDDLYLISDVYFSIYLYKSNPVKLELSYDSNKAISFIFYDNYLEFDISEEDSMSYIKFNNGKIDLFFEGIGYGNGTYDKDSFKVDFVDYSDNSIGNISYSINKNDNKYSNKMSFNLDLSDIDIFMNFSNEIEVNKSIPNINVNNSIIVDNMPEKDKETLSELLSTINLIFAF